MIISTSKSDTMLRRALGKNRTTIITIEKMIDQLALDPELTNPPKEAFIITDEDIRATRIKQKFEQAVQAKHFKVKVIFVNKGAKSIYPNGYPGIDCILTKPKPEDITNAITHILANDVVAETANDAYQKEEEVVPEFTPQETEMVFERQYEEPEPAPVAEPVHEEPLPIPEPEPEPVKTAPPAQINTSQIVERIKSAGQVAEVSLIAREIKSADLIKDLVDTNTTYAGIEEKLKSINDAIFTIMHEPGAKLDDQLARIRALIHDKNYFASKGDTLLEQRLEEVIDTIVNHTSTLLGSRLAEIDTAITNAKRMKDMENCDARLSGLNEERVNLILELRTLELEINSIFKSTDEIITGTITAISERAVDIAGNDVINAHIRARGNTIISDESLAAIGAAIEMSTMRTSESFKDMKRSIVYMIELLGKLFDLDREIIAAQQALINFLKSNNIEDTVIATTLLKKSLRLFVGNEGTGRTIIPYLLSNYKSRQNANVLLFDITGTGKYQQYGIQTMEPEQFLNGYNQQEFLVVSGSIESSVANIQRIILALTRAADYYRVINVVMSPEQKELFEVIAPDVLCINYLVDTNVANIRKAADFIKESTFPNVARRVIINRCDIPIRNIITMLGLDDQIDFQCCVVPTIPAVTDAALGNYNPYGISSVTLALEETLKHA